MSEESKIIRFLPSRIRDYFSARSSLRGIAKNVIWLLFDKGYSTILSFLIGVLVARYLGPERFGLMNYAISFVAMSRVISSVGLEEILTRELVNSRGQEGQILTAGMLIRCAGTLLATLLLFIAINIIKPDSSETRFLVMIASIINFGNLLMIFQRYFHSQLKAKYVVIASNISLTIFALVKFGLIYLGAPVSCFVAAVGAQVLLTGIILLSIYITKNRTYGHLWRLKGDRFRELLVHAWPRMVAGVSDSIGTNIGIVIIGGYLCTQQLGEYSLAHRMFMLLLFFPNIVCQSLTPSLAKVFDNNSYLFPDKLLLMYRILFFSQLALALVTIPLSLFVLPLVFGAEYQVAGKLLAVLALSLPLFGLRMGRCWFIVIRRAFKYEMYMSVFTALLNIALLFLSIIRFGLWGAVITVFIVQFFHVLIFDLFSKGNRLSPITAWKTILCLKYDKTAA